MFRTTPKRLIVITILTLLAVFCALGIWAFFEWNDLFPKQENIFTPAEKI